MLRVELSEEEQDLLGNLLQNAVNQLEFEIERTDGHQFKKLLKHRRDVLKGLTAKLPLAIQHVS